MMDQSIVRSLNASSDDVMAVIDARNAAAADGATHFVLLYNSRAATLAAALPVMQTFAPYFDVGAVGLGNDIEFNITVNGTLFVSSVEQGLGYVRLSLPSRSLSFARIGASVAPNGLASLERSLWTDLSTCKGSSKLIPFTYRLPGRSLMRSTNGLRYCRSSENVINVIALRSLMALVGSSFAIINTGAIRDDLPGSFVPDTGLGLRRTGSVGPFDVVAGDTDAVSPFANAVVGVNVTSAELCAIAQWALCSDGAPQITRQLMGSVSGITFTGTFFPNLTCVLTDVRFTATKQPVDCSIRNDTFLVATLSFLTGGGDRFPLLSRRAVPYNKTDRDVLFSYLTEYGKVHPALEPHEFLPFEVIPTRIERVCNRSYILEIQNGWYVSIPAASFARLGSNLTCVDLRLTPVDARTFSRKDASLTSVSTVLAPPNDFSIIYRNDGLLVGQVVGYGINVTIISSNPALDGELFTIDICLPESKSTLPWYNQFRQPSIAVQGSGSSFSLATTITNYNATDRGFWPTYCGTIQVRINRPAVYVAARSVSTSSSTFNTTEQVRRLLLLVFFFSQRKKKRCSCSFLEFYTLRSLATLLFCWHII